MNYMILFKSYKYPSSYFNINDFIFCSFVSTRSSSGFKLQHIGSSTTLTHNFYFFRLPRLWNSLPTIDISLSINTIKHKLQSFLWNYFINNFEDNNLCTLRLHYYFPVVAALTGLDNQSELFLDYNYTRFT